MTLEIIVFVLAILLGIVMYWRESKSSKLYRFFNKLTHSKKLQMKPEDKKGFVYKQPFLMRLVWITLFFVLGAALITVVTPINVFFIQYFVSAIVGVLIGTYLATIIVKTNTVFEKENIEKVFEKGKEYIEDLTVDDNPEESNQTLKNQEDKIKTPKKSARERFKDKGMIK